MRRTLHLLTPILLMLPMAIMAQSPFEQRASQTSGIEFHTTSYGIFGLDVRRGDGGMFYPRGSSLQYIFGSGLWFGTSRFSGDSTEDRTFLTYDPNSGASWATPGDFRRDGAIMPVERTWLGYSPEYHKPTGIWMGSASQQPSWPHWTDGRAPVKLSNPGTFVSDPARRIPALSGTPAFVPRVAEQFVSRYHDGDLERYNGEEIASHPIGLQIEQNVYGFSEPGLENIVILHYRIINVSDDTLLDCHTGQMIDPDIGHPANDRASYYGPRHGLGTAYVFSDATNNDGTKYGTLVQTLLESPAVETNRESNRLNYIRHDKLEYDSTEQLGVVTFQNWSITFEDPKTHPERNDFMAEHNYDFDEGPQDVRILLVTGPFNMLPGDTARYAIALMVLPDLKQPAAGAVPEIEAAAEKVLGLYRSAAVSGVRESRGESEAFTIGAVLPNPVSGRATVELHLPHRASATVELVDMLGRVVLSRESGMLEAGEQTIGIYLSGVAPGVYLLSVESEDRKRSERLVVSP